MCRMYKILLELQGFNVLGWANNGDEALKIIKTDGLRPDVILLDHRMPIRNGIDTASVLLEEFKSIKIIFVSADTSIKEKVLRLGASYFIEKPFHYDDLVEIINSII